ncbi:ANTAR domain-containing protein [Kribbella turkmenica]|uniref:ANTAR domain-containing protein n=1 Tax=Kribbella turkmenica TaxID=2530375 RepID=A0A4R4WRE2_9ACTN|nr:ANTAR domain-containing protein [Kribbella turkmenica]TDD17990.1 ANTAR domain-containing protein [Kribbella turkmenica]
MVDRTEILTKLARLAATNAQGHLADRLCDAARLILNATGAWIAVQEGPTRLALSATDARAGELEDLQDVLGQGPCVTAAAAATTVTAVVRDQPDPRWPEFSRAAWQRVGPTTIQAIPMRPGDQQFGVLAAYFTDGGPTESDESALFLAAAIGAALLRDPELTGDPEADGKWSARAEVHQATGMVVVQLRISPDDALAILRAHAYAHDSSLGEIAHLVVTRRLDFRGDA